MSYCCSTCRELDTRGGLHALLDIAHILGWDALVGALKVNRAELLERWTPCAACDHKGSYQRRDPITGNLGKRITCPECKGKGGTLS